jgi:hypothetical protein
LHILQNKSVGNGRYLIQKYCEIPTARITDGMGWGVEGEWSGEGRKDGHWLAPGEREMSRQRTGEVGCWVEARRVQSMVKLKPAGSPHAATRHPAESRCRAEARRVQSMVKMKPAGSPRAATRHPAESRCRAEARRVQSMVKTNPAAASGTRY